MFVVGVNWFSTTIKQIESDPLVSKLNAENFKVRVSFDSSPCFGAEAACFTSPSFDDSSWPELGLLRIPLQQFPGYKAGEVFYRFRVPVSESLINSGKPFAFTPLYMSHERWQVYVNGRLVDLAMGSGLSLTVSMVPLAPSDVVDGFAQVTMKASASNSERGIFHVLSMFVGPRDTLNHSYMLQERAGRSYFLFYLLSKGSIFVAFTLFFFFSRDRRALFYYLIYAFFVTIENLIAGEFFSNVDRLIRVPTFYMVKVTAFVALLSFFCEYFQAYRARRAVFILNSIFVAIIGGLCLDYSVGTQTIVGMTIFHTTSVILVVTLLVGLTFGVMALRRWRSSAGDPGRIGTLKLFVAVIALYLALIIWEFAFKQYLGFDRRALFDLLFFYFVAFVTAKEFGFNQGQVITLEGHMLEKARMEQELAEAAEIAKAFLPGAAPNWEFCRLEVFHRSLSESSGDWFTFERSPSGRLFHMLMCDITGHGVQAAIVVSTCKTVLSSMIAERPDVTESPDFIPHYAAALNRILHTHGSGSHVSTLLGLTFEPGQRKLHYVAAGHPSPLLVRSAAQMTIKPLLSRYNVLGVRPEAQLVMTETTLEPGDEILAFTDGLPASSHVRALRQILADLPAGDAARSGELQGRNLQDLYQRIWAVETAKSSTEPNDDVSIVWFRMAA